ncbi:carbohydrate ABC transporter permease [Limnochorda pilosa]|uniref:Binding-protein-dependent transport systems inner membrane component n=1 Tax=Limnochorda pilosa TaxID=1555112 RepID=A0A0K2SLM0_LIMPI|nr:carbohydrate ABC transporter permease [Limnochorda pilosa]BAS27907.1 binding-protein-dependent transport systems inner membrane component [Limnochorda pilosa]
MSRRRRVWVQRAALYLAVALVCLWVLAPFTWLVISSLSTRVDLTSVPLQWLPDKPNLEHYRSIFLGGPGSTSVHRSLRRGALNSLVVATGATFLALAAGSLAAYAVTRLRFRLRGPFLATLLVTQLLPPVVLIIPMYVIFRSLRLLDTVWALMLADLAIILPLIVWILKGYFEGVPEGLEEQARIDGCTRAGALFRVVLPLSAPGLAAGGMFAFIVAWNEFFTAFIFSSTLQSKTLSVIVSEFSSKVGIDYVAMSTAGVLTSIPPVLLALLFQRYIIRGLTAGAVKG